MAGPFIFGRVDLYRLLNPAGLTDDYDGDPLMATSNMLSASVQAELMRRHKATATTVVSLLVGVILLCALAFVSQKFLTQRNNPSLHMTVLITILIFGLGAIAFRRTKFAVMRLQDIGALRGPSGLLTSLQQTTLQVAFIGAAVAVIGFCSHARDRGYLIHLPGGSRGGCSPTLLLSHSNLLGTSSQAVFA